MAAGLAALGPAPRPADAARKIVSATSEADAAAKNAAEPLCKICPCTTRTRTVQASSESSRTPGKPAARVHVVFDGSTSFVHANAGPGASTGRLGDVKAIRTARKTAALGVGHLPLSSWAEAWQDTPAGKPRSEWARAIRDAEELAPLQVVPDPVLHWIGLREGDKSWAGPTENGPQTGVYSPVSTFLIDLIQRISSPNTCDPDVFIVVTDGLDHLDSKTDEVADHSGFGNVWSKLAPTSRVPTSRVPTSRVLIARANPLSRYELFTATQPSCTFKDPVAGTRTLPESQCAWVDIEEPLATPFWGKIGDWNAYKAAVTGLHASSTKLRDATLNFLQLVARDIEGLEACEGTTTTVEGEATTEYEAEQELPLPPVGDALLLGDDTQWKCTGALVDAGVVLTAAHCLPITRVASTDDASQPGVVKRVKEVARPANDRADAALLLLDRPLAAPSGLRRSKSQDSGPQGALRFVGFGATDSQGRGGFGHRHVVDLSASGWGCDGNRVETTGCVPGFEMVVPGSAGHDTCRGDSGGPLYELWGNGKVCGYRLVGITARRVADAVVPCGNGGIYTRVDVLDEWISERIATWKRKDTKEETP